MILPHDPRRYIEEAAEYRKKAAAAFNDLELRDSYLALARSCEMLVDALVSREPSAFGKTASERSYELTDFEWEVIAPLLPRVDDRRVLSGIFWILGTGAPWAALPKEFGHFGTCHQRLSLWRKAGVWDRVLTALTKAYDDNMEMSNSALLRALHHAVKIDATPVRILRHAANSINGTRIAVEVRSPD